jgi:hypothetical protein
MAAQPVDEIVDLGVAPHPGRKAGERLVVGLLERTVANVAVDTVGVRPVGFDGDDREAVPLDQPAGDGRPRPVELRRTMGGLAQEDDLGGGEAIEQRSERVIVVEGWQRLAEGP